MAEKEIIQVYSKSQADAKFLTTSAVTSVNDKTGKVTLDATDITETPTRRYVNTSQINKLDGIAADATKNDTDANLKDRANHTGAQAISTVTGLQDELNGKSATSHGHAISDVTNLQNTLNGKASTSHGHSIENITGLQNALDGKAATSHDHPIGDLDTTGTASSATYLRGDGSWATPEGGGAVDSVNGATGTVVLDPDDLNDAFTAHKFTTATEINKLEGIATGATQNSTDVALRARASHTGTQAISTVTGLQDELNAKASATIAVNAVTSNYTLVLTDAGKAVEMSNASSRTVTVPQNSSVAFPVGTVIEITRMGTGAVTIVQGTGATLRSAGGLLALRTQYSSASIRKRDTNEWVVVGDLA